MRETPAAGACYVPRSPHPGKTQDFTVEALGELPHSEPYPDQARYTHAYAVALHSAGRVGDAVTVLKEGLVRHS